VAYIEALRPRIVGRELRELKLLNPFVLRTVDPPPSAFIGLPVNAIERIGKRIAFLFPDELSMVIHLMIAGRFRWLEGAKKPPGKISLAAFRFDTGTLVFTEAGSKRRASLHLFRGDEALRNVDPGGIEVLEVDAATFGRVLQRERHTLKRTLTDPRMFSGIGNAYSDEILHRARLSPVQMSTNLDEEEIIRLHRATQDVLREWSERLTAEAMKKFPEHVTAFREEMAMHGKYGKPCPDCGSPVQRIVYAENETNYCARCQTGGRLLADRALSRLLREDWPKSIDDIE
jgi:formamidopyrimidine-DNA glycosylase